MRYYIRITALLLLSGCAAPPQSHHSAGGLAMYERAYEYIQLHEATSGFLEDEQNVSKPFSIAVSDSIVFLEWSSFFDYFRTKSNSDEAVVLDSILALDRESSFQGYKVAELGSLGNKEETPLILFFSRPRDNLLLAELLYNYNSEKGYSRISAFNQGLLFLLFFDSSGEVRESTTTLVEYN